MPCRRQASANSKHRRLLPIPASPTTPPTAKDVARRGIKQPRQPERFYRRRDAPNGLLAERYNLHELFGADIGISGDKDAALIRHLFHSMCEMDIRAGCVVGLINTVF